MDINDIKRKFHTASLQDLIPAKTSQYPPNINGNTYKNDLWPPYSAFVDLFGTELAEFCCYCAGGLVPESYYYDESNYTIISLTPFLLDKGLDAKETLEYLIKDYQTHLKKYGLLSVKVMKYIPEPFISSLVSKYIEENDVPYDDFIKQYIQLEYGFDSLPYKRIKKILLNTHKPFGQDFIQNLPEVVTIYRGAGDKSSPVGKSFSWTLNKNVAYFFAVKNAQEYAYIYEAKVTRENIRAYINERNEEELLVFYEDLELINTIKLPSINEYANNNSKLIWLLRELMEIYGNYEDLLEEYTNDTRDHTSSHVQRVALLAGILYMEETGKKTDKTLKSILNASFLHDLGRDNDEVDESHGRKSVDILKEENIKLPQIVYKIIKYHCLDDEKFIKECHPSKKELFKYQVLKDADALDRVRFGIRALDVDYLRLESSKRMILIAEQLLKMRIL